MRLSQRHLRAVTTAAVVLVTGIAAGGSVPASWADGGHTAAAVRQHLRATDLVEDCSDGTYTLAISDITLDPAFPRPGEPLHWRVSGTVRQAADLDDSQARLTVKLGLITLLRKTSTLAELLQQWGAALPADHQLPAGPVTLNGTNNLPREIPRGDFRILLEAWDQYEEDLTCLKMHVDFRRPR